MSIPLDIEAQLMRMQGALAGMEGQLREALVAALGADEAAQEGLGIAYEAIEGDPPEPDPGLTNQGASRALEVAPPGDLSMGDANEELSEDPAGIFTRSVYRRVDLDGRFEIDGTRAPEDKRLTLTDGDKTSAYLLVNRYGWHPGGTGGGFRDVVYWRIDDLLALIPDPGEGNAFVTNENFHEEWCRSLAPIGSEGEWWLEADWSTFEWECEVEGGWPELINMLIERGIIKGFWKTGDADGSTTIGKIIRDTGDEADRMDLKGYMGGPALLGHWYVQGADQAFDTDCSLTVLGPATIWGDVQVGEAPDQASNLNILMGVLEVEGKQVVGARGADVVDEAAYTGTTIASYTGIDSSQSGSVYAALADLNDLRSKVEALGKLTDLNALRGKHNDLAGRIRTHGLIGV